MSSPTFRMRPSRGVLAAACGALLLTGGCTSWRDRLHDLGQVIEVRGSVGPGVGLSLRATEAAQIGFGSFDGDSAGWVDGRFATMRDQRSELGVSLLHTYEYRRESSDLLSIRQPHFADSGYEEHPLSWRMQSDRRLADVGLDVHLVYVGFGAAIHLDELWDFVAGCFGFDPLHDDAYGRSLDELRLQAASLDPDRRDRAFDALKRRGEPIHGYAIYSASEVTPEYQRRAIDAVGADGAAPKK